MENIENSPEILQTLWTLFIFHSQHEVQEILVVHFTLVGLVFFKYTVNEYICQTRGVSGQLLLLKHTVLVTV